MHIEALFDLLKAPLGLSADTIIKSLSGGAINCSFHISDALNEFMVKHFQGEETLSIDRQERFDMQLLLYKVGLAPKPLYLNTEQGIYAEQWIKRDSIKPPSYFNDGHIGSLANALTRIHSNKIQVNKVDLPKDWQNYLSVLMNPSIAIVEQVALLTKQWTVLNEETVDEHVFCHNDLAWDHLCLPTNIIFDWEYAGIGNRYFDVLSCARINGLDHQQSEVLVTSYAKLNGISIEEAHLGCRKQARFLELTYQLWHQAFGLTPKI